MGFPVRGALNPFDTPEDPVRSAACAAVSLTLLGLLRPPNRTCCCDFRAAHPNKKCMYVCMYVCIYVYIHPYVHMRVRAYFVTVCYTTR